MCFVINHCQCTYRLPAVEPPLNLFEARDVRGRGQGDCVWTVPGDVPTRGHLYRTARNGHYLGVIDNGSNVSTDK